MLDVMIKVLVKLEKIFTLLEKSANVCPRPNEW